MRTSGPISSISYNTIPFLKEVLDSLIDSKDIEFYFFIWHKGEDDEAGEKDHIHVYVEPAHIINTVDFKELFKEVDPKHEKPLGTIIWKKSNFMNAYMYFLHDKAYLAFKGQSRQYNYDPCEVITNDRYILRYYVFNINLLDLTPYADMIKAQEDGLSFQEYFRRGRIPIQQVSSWERSWYLLKENKNNRNGKEGHK